MQINTQISAGHYATTGIQQGFERLTDNTQKIVHPESGQQTEALIDNTQVAKQVESSVKALKTYDGMIGTLLDVIA